MVPTDVTALLEDLSAIGYAIVREQRSGGFGDHCFHLSNATGPAVRIGSDRGLWFAEISIGTRFHDVYSVQRAIRAAPYSRRAQSHAERRASTMAAIRHLSRDDADLDAVLQRLEQYRTEYNRALRAR